MKRWMLAILVTITATARADWPAHIFAPYEYVGSGDNFQLAACDDQCGQKYYTLAFIISDSQNNPAWDGRFPTDQGFYAAQIDAIRKRGGDVIISFGGEAGTELAIAEKDPVALFNKYQGIIDRYKFTYLDFDIEGDALPLHRGLDPHETMPYGVCVAFLDCRGMAVFVAL